MKISWNTCFKLCLSAFVLYLCISYWPSFSGFAATVLTAAMPLIIGCIIAYVINIPMSFFECHYFPDSTNKRLIKSRRVVCMLAAFVSIVLVLLLLMKLVIPELAASVELLLSQLPMALSGFVDWLETLNIIPEDILSKLQGVDWNTKARDVLGLVTSGIGSVMGTAVNIIASVFSGIVTALFALIFAIYLLSGKERIGSQFDRLMKRYMKTKLYCKSRYVLTVLNTSFHKYIVGQCTEAIILGTLCTIGMLILGFPYATMTGAVIAFTALIPVAGGYIGAAVGAFMILTVEPVKAIFFLIYIVILQQIEGNLIYPRVVGSSMGLPAIWVLAAVTIGGGVMGIAGMLLGVPLAAAIYRLLREDVEKGLIE